MEFRFLLQFINILYMVWLGSYLQSTESIPVSTSATFAPEVTNSSALPEYLKFNSGESREVKTIGLSNVSNDHVGVTPSESTDIVDRKANKKRLRKNLFSTVVVPYLCDFEKRMCRLNQNQESLVIFFVPIKLLPDKQPPTEIGLKEFYSLVSKTKKQQMDNFDSIDPKSTVQEQHPSSGAHSRRKRDTQYSEADDNPQQEWANQGEYEADQSPRVQRNIPTTSTEQVPTSTEGRTQRNADLQASKQSKRSAEADDDEAEDDDFGSPSPDDDYQDDNDMDYHPEKRFAGPETAGTTPKSGDSATKNPSQLSRRAAMNPNYNYPLFPNPDFYYPSQRILSPFDGISYRSVDALPMMYMDPNQAFWQAKFARSPQRYYQQRQAAGYGRGWPPGPSYYQPYANRYQPTYPQAQQNRGYYHRQYPQQSSYNPFSYSYAQGNKNYKAPVRKPIETDANMYYGK